MAGIDGLPLRLEVTDILVGGECPVGSKVGGAWLIENGRVAWSGSAEFSGCCPDTATPSSTT